MRKSTFDWADPLLLGQQLSAADDGVDLGGKMWIGNIPAFAH